MGATVAANLLLYGHTVRILDDSGLPSDAAQSIVRELLRPYLEECALEGVLERFSVACNLQRLLSGGFRFVIEAGEGGLAVKRDVFRRVASHFKKHGVPASTVVLCSAKVVLCSDTSILPIEEIASGMQAKYKARCIELRFFDPALHIGKMVVMYLDRPPPPSFVEHVDSVLSGLPLTPLQPKAHGESTSSGAADASPDAMDGTPTHVIAEESRPANASGARRMLLLKCSDDELEPESLGVRRRVSTP